MTQTRMAYMPLATYPEVVEDESILAAASFAASLESTLNVMTFSVDIPRVSPPLTSLFVDIPGHVRAAEEKSKAECDRLQGLVQGTAASRPDVHCTSREVVLGAVLDAAAAAARYFDLAVLPWSREMVAAQHMIEAVVFGSGRPTILVPSSARPATVDHIAIAWDASRVAARALGDALPLLAEGGRVSVLTVRDEKPLGGSDLAHVLAASLEKRGFNAAPLEITLGERTIAKALQDTALSQGVQVLAMGGFGHSRIRDFVLGGATKGVFADLRLPVLLAH
ncbi:MAG: universal stress protein [Reyranella sp.]|nr:universal stress protein [Reyranella sp.]